VIRVGIAGAGVMGANHARVASRNRDVRVTHVSDPDVARAATLATSVGATAVASLSEVAGELDVAIVATPTVSHVAVAEPLLRAGVAVLVEKPLAPTAHEARLLVEAAASSGVLLMVGHIERFNAAVRELHHQRNGIVHFESSRISPYSGRIRDDVVTDLLIHDLDLALMLLGEQVEDVSAVGRTVRSDTLDLAAVLLRFAGGATAALSASRIGQQKIRQIQLTKPDSYVVADLVRMDVTVTRVASSEYLSDTGMRYRQSGVVEIPFLENRAEPLALEQQELFDAVREGRPPTVTGEDGVRALRLVEAVLEALDQRPRPLGPPVPGSRARAGGGAIPTPITVIAEAPGAPAAPVLGL
jgi:predicted dehydrogenase